ncbi:MAG: hypothetical protein IJU86_03955 [Firmicutes bacterium]|nr:hypothetical protein [Bacillota bacterium]
MDWSKYTGFLIVELNEEKNDSQFTYIFKNKKNGKIFVEMLKFDKYFNQICNRIQDLIKKIMSPKVNFDEKYSLKNLDSNIIKEII